MTVEPAVLVRRAGPVRRAGDRTSGRLRRIGYTLGVVPAAVGLPQRAFDWSGWRPTDEQMRGMVAAGIVGVQRYESDDAASNQWKCCSKSEYDRILACGLAILAGFEVGKTSWLGGYSLGVQHGQMARAKWRAKGHPDSRPIAFAVDSDVSSAQLGIALDYLRGCMDGTRTGPQIAYGEPMVIDAALKAGIVRSTWETAAYGWSGYHSTTCALRQTTAKDYPQYPPTQYDQNDILAADWGQHPYGGQPPVGHSFMLAADD